MTKFRQLVVIVLSVALVAALTAGGYYFYQYRTLRQKLANPAELAREQSQVLIRQVSRLMELPTDEEPTVATVADAAQLSATQPFFAKAKNGFRVLIYPRARLAILYDPQTNKIINVGTISIGNETATPSGEQPGLEQPW